jgi:hypothetical protein
MLRRSELLRISLGVYRWGLTPNGKAPKVYL